MAGVVRGTTAAGSANDAPRDGKTLGKRTQRRANSAEPKVGAGPVGVYRLRGGTRDLPLKAPEPWAGVFAVARAIDAGLAKCEAAAGAGGDLNRVGLPYRG